jgi:hypothetical protein
MAEVAHLLIFGRLMHKMAYFVPNRCHSPTSSSAGACVVTAPVCLSLNAGSQMELAQGSMARD